MTAPRHSIFISYRIRETAFAVDQLDHALRLAFGEDAVFRDVRSIRKGQDFPSDIRAALSDARVGLVVIGPWWLTIADDPKDPTARPRLLEPEDWVRREVAFLLTRESAPGHALPVIPLFTGGAPAPKAGELPESLKPLAGRSGMSLDAYPDTEHSIARIVEGVASILRVTPQPRSSPSPVTEESPPRIGGTPFSVTGTKFVGREQELHLLDEAWGRSRAADKINIVSLIGQGGEGKSALVLEWLGRRARRGWDGARRVFQWSFYTHGTSGESGASADEFFNAAFTWFGGGTEVPKDSLSKGARLAELIGAERTLLILDGLEPLQHPPGGFGGEFTDPALKALVRGLALSNKGLCVLTSRIDITDIAAYERAEGPCVSHRIRSLDPTAAIALLRTLGVSGPENELREAAEWFRRHAYDLNLLGNYLRECTNDHDIRGWQQRFPILKEDERIHDKPDSRGGPAGHGVRMLRAYERWLEPKPIGWRQSLPTWLGGRRRVPSAALAILRLLGLFDRPVRSDLLDELRALPVIRGLTEPLVNLAEQDWRRALAQLEQLGLVHLRPLSLPGELAVVKPTTVSADEVTEGMLDVAVQEPEAPDEFKIATRAEQRLILARRLTERRNHFAKSAERQRRAVTFVLDTHPLLREHFGAELRVTRDSSRCEAHARLFTYLRSTTPDKPDATLEDLQPLYQAVAHGCQAGRHLEACVDVYLRRIQRGPQAYSSKRLGAFASDLAAAARFFDEPWQRVSPVFSEEHAAWLFNDAAFSLRGLGRLTEALQPAQAGLTRRVRQEDWENASACAVNLSELRLELGDVAGAITESEHALIYADRSGDLHRRIVCRTAHANSLHQAGRRTDAEEQFHLAEQMQGQFQRWYPLLYSIQGADYCELLLSEAQRAAWVATLAAAEPPSNPTARPEDHQGSIHTTKLAAVAARAAQILRWATEGNLSPLSVALSRLTLGCGALYQAILEGTDVGVAQSNIEESVHALRCAGQSVVLPKALLTRAWLRTMLARSHPASSAVECAASDLNEAWEFAQRGPHPLLLADIHLHRARLSFRASSYPWTSPQHDLAEARRILFATGYLRRKEELEDAESVINGRAGE